MSKLKKTILKELIDRGAQDIVSIDISHITDAIASYLIICEANSTTQVASLAHYVSAKVKEQTHEVPYAMEGKEHAQWIILDYVDIIVHVFYKGTRQYYQLEDLWSEGFATRYDSQKITELD